MDFSPIVSSKHLSILHKFVVVRSFLVEIGVDFSLVYIHMCLKAGSVFPHLQITDLSFESFPPQVPILYPTATDQVFYMVNANRRFASERANLSYGVVSYFAAELLVTALAQLLWIPGITIAFAMVRPPTGRSYDTSTLLSGSQEEKLESKSFSIHT